MRPTTHVTSFALATVVLVIGGCDRVEQTVEGIRLSIIADASTDVAQMRFTVERMSCAGEAVIPLIKTADRDIESGPLPPGVPDSGVDPASRHQLADWFAAVPPGCYRASIQPLTVAGQPSQQCAPMSRASVVVERGRTTEATLVSQCQSEGRGAIDVVALLNHAPEILDIQFATSKFIPQCTIQEICVTVRDPDLDPLEIVWRQTSSAVLVSGQLL